MRALLVLGCLLVAACRAPAPAAPAPAKRVDRLESHWDPATGRGDVRHFYANGDIARTCFHCDYPGYTGGLVVGGFNGSGMGFYPKVPIRGFRAINVLCAQDESIRDLADGREWTWGWSENFGKGDDGERLEYQRGRVIAAGPERVVLQSENAGGCFRVTKLAYTRAAARWWIVATRVVNRCKSPVRFDLWSGDDPWVGRYRSAEGDVGWTPAGLHEREADLWPFTEGGVYDLGSTALGQSQAAFSAQADFLAIDPALPLPDRALLARKFAHDPKEIDPTRVLDATAIIALNLGWTDRTLAPGQGLTVALAMGLSDVGQPGQTPRIPAISAQDWSVWRTWLRESPDGAPRRSPAFAAEEVELDLTASRLDVTGTYWLRNDTDTELATEIRYPVLVAPDRPAPRVVVVDGRSLATTAGGTAGTVEVRFPIRVPPLGLARFQCRYQQTHTGHEAAYLVTSANSWPAPIGRAVFRIRHPAALGPVVPSLPPDRIWHAGTQVEQVIVRHKFRPDGEVVLRWGTDARH